jgi:benzoyl-CoA reductase/2-hydroxyglutaryl-CoA dehydratase subunit BcrC/BadD/HgdB
MAPDNRIGITATVPIEVLLAAGCEPVDLNNLFIGRGGAEEAVGEAERAGFPRNTCAWIKGIYATVRAERFARVLVVTGGDCSNAGALGEVLADDGVEVLEFSFPAKRDREAMAAAVEALARRLRTTAAAAGEVYARLAPGRELLRAVDELTWREGVVSGRENSDWLLRACDFAGGVERFEREAEGFLAEARRRPGRAGDVRLGIAGVPPINDDLFEYVEGLGAAVAFNELPRQFALLGGGADLVAAYTAYTYPYGVRPRLDDIEAEIKRRDLHGLIHYVQAFCYRGIQDILLRREAPVPILTLEGERPGPLSAQQKLRLETFVELLRQNVGQNR